MKCLSQIQKAFFSFITMDIQMPEMDGITCSKLIRKHEQSNHYSKAVPIIIVTGNYSEEERKECLDPERGIQASYIYKKPLSFTDCQLFVGSISSQT